MKRKVILFASLLAIGGAIGAVQATMGLTPDSDVTASAALGAIAAAFVRGVWAMARSVLPSVYALLKGAEKEITDELREG